MIIPERLARLPDIVLDRGQHATFEEGHSAIEVIAWITGHEQTEDPTCVSPVLVAFLRRANDALGDEDRQKLKPYLPRVIDTAGDGHDELRGWLALDWFVRVYTPTWLELAGATKSADALRALPALRDLDPVNDAGPVIDATGRKPFHQDRKDPASNASRDTFVHTANAAALHAARDARGAALRDTNESAVQAAVEAGVGYDAYWRRAWVNASSVGDGRSWHRVWSAASFAAWDAVFTAAWPAARAVAKRYNRQLWRRELHLPAAWDAAWEKLEPTTIELQASSLELLEDLVDPGGGSMPSAGPPRATPRAVIPERLERLPEIVLDRGRHATFEEGHSATEVIAWITGQEHTRRPARVSPVLVAFLRSANDGFGDEDRQKLKPYLPRAIGTAGDGHDELRGWLALDWLVRVCLPTWLELAGVTESAGALRALPALRDLDTVNGARPLIEVARRTGEATGAVSRERARYAAGYAVWPVAHSIMPMVMWEYSGYAFGGTVQDLGQGSLPVPRHQGASWAPVRGAICNAAEDAVSGAIWAPAWDTAGHAAWEVAGYAGGYAAEANAYGSVAFDASPAVKAAATDASDARDTIYAAIGNARRAAGEAVAAAASPPAWNAAWDAASRYRWRWTAVRNAARRAAWEAARERLEPTTIELQASALELLEDLVDPAGGLGAIGPRV